MPKPTRPYLHPVEKFEVPLADLPPEPARVAWVSCWIWLGAILFSLACWAVLLVWWWS